MGVWKGWAAGAITCSKFIGALFKPKGNYHLNIFEVTYCFIASVFYEFINMINKLKEKHKQLQDNLVIRGCNIICFLWSFFSFCQIEFACIYVAMCDLVHNV